MTLKLKPRQANSKSEFENIISLLRREHPLIAQNYETAEVVQCSSQGVLIRFPNHLAGGGIFGTRAITKIRAVIDVYFHKQDVPFEVSIYYAQS